MPRYLAPHLKKIQLERNVPFLFTDITSNRECTKTKGETVVFRPFYF